MNTRLSESRIKEIYDQLEKERKVRKMLASGEKIEDISDSNDINDSKNFTFSDRKENVLRQ
jgi:hypothetical protein